jgi:hypothetical protein
MTLRLNGSTSGYSEIDAPAVAGDQTFTLPGTGGTLDRLNRAGNILQVVSATKTDTFSRASSSSDYGDITGLSVSITPTSATSKILIYTTVVGSGNTGQRISVRLMRDSTAISIGDSAGNRSRSSSAGAQTTGGNDTVTLSSIFLDSPNTTLATTYKVQCSAEGSQTFYLNRGSTDSDADTVYRAASSITVMEVAA